MVRMEITAGVPKERSQRVDNEREGSLPVHMKVNPTATMPLPISTKQKHKRAIMIDALPIQPKTKSMCNNREKLDEEPNSDIEFQSPDDEQQFITRKRKPESDKDYAPSHDEESSEEEYEQAATRKKVTPMHKLVPPKRQKNSACVDIPTHLLTIMAQKLKENKTIKTTGGYEKLECGIPKAVTMKAKTIYDSLPDKLKKLLQTPVHITSEEELKFQQETEQQGNGKFKCLTCDLRDIRKQYEAIRHVKTQHHKIPLYICGYGNCSVASNSTKSLGAHTIFTHFYNLFKNIEI